MLAESYHSGLVAQIKADDFTYRAGRLTVHLAREFGPYGVRVNGVHPGPMDALPRRKFLEAQAAAQGVTADSLDAPARERTALGHLASAEDVMQAYPRSSQCVSASASCEAVAS